MERGYNERETLSERERMMKNRLLSLLLPLPSSVTHSCSLFGPLSVWFMCTQMMSDNRPQDTFPFQSNPRFWIVAASCFLTKLRNFLSRQKFRLSSLTSIRSHCLPFQHVSCPLLPSSARNVPLSLPMFFVIIWLLFCNLNTFLSVEQLGFNPNIVSLERLEMSKMKWSMT